MIFAPRSYGEVQKLTENVYLFRNITNSSFVIGDHGVAVIDTQVNPPSAQFLLSAVRHVTDKPIRYVINTHYHWDHTNGNEIFKAQGACLVSSKLTRDFMLKRNRRQREFLEGRGFQLGKDPLIADITFEGDYRIDLGGQPLYLFFAGRAETDDAIAVHIPRENVLMSGDTIMTGSFPIFGQPVWDEGLQGDGAWARTIAGLMAFEPRQVVPGHGPLATDEDIALFIRIQEYFIQEVKALVQKGYDLPGVLQDLEPRLPLWMRNLPVVWGTPRYAILRVFRGLTRHTGDPEPGWQRFKPSAIPEGNMSVFREKINGQESAGDFFQMAREADEGGDAGLKLAILKRATEVFPHSPDAFSRYADALIEASRAEASVLEKGDFFEAAWKAWGKALALEPAYVPSLLGKGRYLVLMAYRAGDDPAEGMALLRKVLEMRPGGNSEAQAEFYLGMGHRRLGEEGQALERFQRSLRLDPAFGPALRAMET